MDSNQNSTPSLCVNNCGFYGNATTRNMCSKCYHGVVKKEQDSAVAANTKNNAVPPPPPTLEAPKADEAMTEAPLSNVEARVQEPTTPFSVVDSKAAGDTAPVVAATAAASSAVPAEAVADVSMEKGEQESAPEKPPQKPGRCYSCNKKVGLLGFSCKCGFVYCGQHRYADSHACDFDYKAHDREVLARNNQVVVADKLEKL